MLFGAIDRILDEMTDGEELAQHRMRTILVTNASTDINPQPFGQWATSFVLWSPTSFVPFNNILCTLVTNSWSAALQVHCALAHPGLCLCAVLLSDAA
jgi:hypothetical protein